MFSPQPVTVHGAFGTTIGTRPRNITNLLLALPISRYSPLMDISFAGSSVFHHILTLSSLTTPDLSDTPSTAREISLQFTILINRRYLSADFTEIHTSFPIYEMPHVGVSE